MPRTPYAGIRYPYLDDVNMNQAAMDMFSDIEIRNSINAARVAELKRTRGAWVEYGGAGIASASGVSTLATYTTEVLDTDNLVNLGTNSSSIFLTKGLWFITGSILLFCGTADIATAMVELWFNTTTSYASSANGPMLGNSVPMTTEALYYASTTTQLQMNGFQQNGSAAAGKVTAARLQVARIGGF